MAIEIPKDVQQLLMMHAAVLTVESRARKLPDVSWGKLVVAILKQFYKEHSNVVKEDYIELKIKTNAEFLSGILEGVRLEELRATILSNAGAPKPKPTPKKEHGSFPSVDQGSLNSLRRLTQESKKVRRQAAEFARALGKKPIYVEPRGRKPYGPRRTRLPEEVATGGSIQASTTTSTGTKRVSARRTS